MSYGKCKKSFSVKSQTGIGFPRHVSQLQLFIPEAIERKQSLIFLNVKNVTVL